MPLFVSNEELARLRRLAAAGEDVKKLEKRHQKTIDRLRREHAEEIEDLEDEADLKIRTLDRKYEKLEIMYDEVEETLREEYNEAEEKAESENKKAIDRLNDTIREKNQKIESLNTRVMDKVDLDNYALELDARSAEIERAAKLVSTERKQLESEKAEFKDYVTDKKAGVYKEGYTDGVSDTLRARDEEVDKAHNNVFDLAKTALGKETTVITTTTAPQQNKQQKN